jgi:hypothetical protein
MPQAHDLDNDFDQEPALYRGTAPPTRYINRRTGAVLITRDTERYDALANEWRRAHLLKGDRL